MNKIRVLIIDEHPVVCQALALRLDAVPCISVVGSICEFNAGLSDATNLQPDVILLELKTRPDRRSRGSSLNPVKAISSLLSSSHSGVIVLTSYLDESERDEALEAGAKRYLLKDIDTSRLIAEIEAVAHAIPPIPSQAHRIDSQNSKQV